MFSTTCINRQDIKSQLHDGDKIIHIAKIGSDYATGHGKRNQRKSEEFDEDGSHNEGYQSLQITCRNSILFKNLKSSGNELLRIFSKSCDKDTNAKMVETMEKFDRAAKDMETQVVEVPDVGNITIEHKLINCMHDGKERLAAVQHKV